MAIIGEIRAFSFNIIPNGWLACDGQVLLIKEFKTLFSIIGTTYGGNGKTTFLLPDLRSRTPIQADDNYPLAEFGGSAKQSLTVEQYPSHNHEIRVNGDAPNAFDANDNYFASFSAADIYVPFMGDGADEAPMGTEIIGSQGAGHGHHNIQPSLSLNYCINYLGEFSEEGGKE
ncbi:tail fiber protein [Puniceicoccaceae bacterium K14]|nr:tail fiber protein [Puniceicoccaceae bacterium K14]